MCLLLERGAAELPATRIVPMAGWLPWTTPDGRTPWTTPLLRAATRLLPKRLPLAPATGVVAVKELSLGKELAPGKELDTPGNELRPAGNEVELAGDELNPVESEFEVAGKELACAPVDVPPKPPGACSTHIPPLPCPLLNSPFPALQDELLPAVAGCASNCPAPAAAGRGGTPALGLKDVL